LKPLKFVDVAFLLNPEDSMHEQADLIFNICKVQWDSSLRAAKYLLANRISNAPCSVESFTKHENTPASISTLFLLA